MVTYLPTRSRAFLLVLLGLVAALGLLVTGLTPAHAGTITCGDGDTLFENRTNPSSQVHIVGGATGQSIQGCPWYSDILTISGDDVYLDQSGAYIRLDPRVACDVTVSGGRDPQGFQTWRNSSYSTPAYVHIGWVGYITLYRMSLCNRF